VIDRPALIAWRSKAPWPDRVQIEQDLLLSRLMIEIALDEVLVPELTMRGGTSLNKLHLPKPLRYSKPFTTAIAKIAENIGLTVSSRQRSGQIQRDRPLRGSKGRVDRRVLCRRSSARSCDEPVR
jgi:hypothetical protein